MKNRRALPALLALGAVGMLCLGTALCVTSGMGLAALGVRPAVPDAGAVAAAAPDETLAEDPGADAGQLSGQAGPEATASEVEPEAPAREPEPEAAPPAPTADAIALDREYRREVERHPEGDAYAAVGHRHRMSSEDVLNVVATVGDYRESLAADARGGLGRGVVGRVEPGPVVPSDLGDMTLTFSLTVIGCPSGRLPDADLDHLARTALVRIVANLPDGVDSYRASLWYQGLRCARAPLGYAATWQREGSRLTLR